jgi:hypothetical protein
MGKGITITCINESEGRNTRIREERKGRLIYERTEK